MKEMKRIGLVAMLATLLLVPGIVLAADDGAKEPEKDKDAGPIVSGTFSGQMITIGPDGKMHSYSFGDDGEELDGIPERFQRTLPKEIRDMMKRHGATWGSDDTDEGKGRPKKGGFSFRWGAASVIGPDGTRFRISLGDDELDGESISKTIEETLERMGTDLPEEARERLRKALKQIPADLHATEAPRLPTRRPDKSLVAIQQKLDKILERLERLEQEVEQLK